jgi:pyruvate/2-oxoglutarate dehydrogenase complex dihydrolipoamide acyltransferase (E2) component
MIAFECTISPVAHSLVDALDGARSCRLEARMTRIPIAMPALGSYVETGTIHGWLKSVGDVIARGDAIVEIETDKTTVEMEATASGTLVEIVHDAGDELPIGETMAWLEDGL